jgi:hypothetical protein
VNSTDKAAPAAAAVGNKVCEYREALVNLCDLED